MKKILFAAQVFGLIVMFPLIVVLEMNHVQGGTPEKNFPSGLTMDKAAIRLHGSTKSTVKNDVFAITFETLLLKTY